MNTIYDWVTVALFAGLILLFLQRSDQTDPHDALWQYLVAAAGCGVVNWLGDAGRHGIAIIGLLCLVLFIVRVLKPWSSR